MHCLEYLPCTTSIFGQSGFGFFPLSVSPPVTVSFKGGWESSHWHQNCLKPIKYNQGIGKTTFDGNFTHNPPPPFGRLPSKVVFHRRSSSIEGLLPSKVVFHQRSSSIKGRLPSKVVFHRRLYFIKGRLPMKVIFHQMSSSIKGRLPYPLIVSDVL